MIRGAIVGTRPADARVRGPLMSFRDGLETLPKTLAGKLGDRVVLRAAVESIARDSAGVRVAANRAVLAARAVVLAVPPRTVATLVGPLAPEASAALAEIEAAPLACVSLAWRAADVARRLDGFGFLAAPGEKLRILGCLWSSSMFAGRASRGDAVLTSFVGGVRDPGSARLDDSRLIELVREDLAAALGASGEPRVLAIDRYDRAIPQYSLGHRQRIARARRVLAALPEIVLAGNYIDGISVGDCVRQGLTAARSIERSIDGGSKTAVDFPGHDV
jgi:oxygen-dependent protoporphyrinogen oxidase